MRLMKPPPEKAGKGKFRENLESIIVAVILALAIRYFMFEAFKIPTGSMAPTLVGRHLVVTCPECGYRFDIGLAKRQDEIHDPLTVSFHCPNCLRDTADYPADWTEGDRILVNKFFYNLGLSTPQRWAVIVFKFPEDRARSTGVPGQEDENGGATDAGTNFIKRLIGLPGEIIELRHGDLYVNGELERKPEDVQEEHWQLVNDTRFFPPAKGTGFWEWEPEDDSEWRIGPNRAKRDARGQSFLQFQRPVRDGYGYNAILWPDGSTGSRGLYPVGDVKVLVDLRAEVPGGYLLLRIRENGVNFLAEIPIVAPGARPGGWRQAMISRDGEGVPVAPELMITAGELTRVGFANVDDTLIFYRSSRRVFTHPLPEGWGPEPPPADERRGNWADNGIWVGLGETRGPVTLERIQVFRDIYLCDRKTPFSAPWMAGEGRPLTVPAGHFFVLGDNSPRSHDGRKWAFDNNDPPERIHPDAWEELTMRSVVPEENLVGQAFLVFWNPWRLRLIR